MRLWHYKIIPYLPNSQLLAQNRECCLIMKDKINDKNTKHILINYIHECEPKEFYHYCWYVIQEMARRSMKITNTTCEYLREYESKFNLFNEDVSHTSFSGMYKPFKKHHNDRYLLQCFYNLQEKYDRGQKDFSKEQYEKLENFMKKKGLIQ